MSPRSTLRHTSRHIQTGFVGKNGSSSRSLGNKWEDMILPGCENPPNCVDSRHLGKSKWDEKLGKIECVFSLYDKMRWIWDDVYLPRGLPYMYSPWLSLPPSPLNLSTPTVAHQTCTWRPWFSKLRDALGGVVGSSRFGGRRDGSWYSIHSLTCNCGNVERWVQQHPPRDGKLAGSWILSIEGQCCTWWMLYSVLTPDYAMER